MIHFAGWRAPLAALTAISTVALAVPPPAAALPARTVAATSAAGLQSTDPERAASLEARRTGRPVEVEELGSETTRVVANPDGSFTADVHVGPSRFRDASGNWQSVDLRLEKRADGTVAPKAHPRGLVLAGEAGAGTHDLARVASGPAALSLGWEGSLPDPHLDGTKATYEEVRPGIDLVLEVTRTGFEQFLVVKNRDAADGVKSLAMPWRTENLTPHATSGGGLELRDAQGRYVGHVPAAEMWDASTGVKSGENLRRAPVGMSVRKAERMSALSLSPQESFLSDPKTKYPVTIDPAPTLKPGFDAFVQNSFNSDQSASKELKLGYVEEGGTFKARSFLRWPTSVLRGKQVTAATMYLWNHWSYSCEAAKWQVWITGGVGTSTNWDNQPAWGGSGKPVVESTMTKGYGVGNCGDGYVTANVRSTFQWAADNNASTLTTGIRASQADEDNGNQKTWKRFSSSEGEKDPYISITYNSKPNVPTELSVGGKRCEPGQPQVFVSRTPYFPNVQAKVTDPDGTERTLRAQFYLAEKGKALPAAPTMQDDATNGTYAIKAIPSGFPLTENLTYVMRVANTDGLDTSDLSVTCEFTVDSAGPAKPPTVTSTIYPECVPAVCNTGGSAGSSGEFQFGPNGVTDVKKYRYWFDGGAKVEVTAATGGAITSVQVAPPLAQSGLHIDDLAIGGQRVLHVESVDQAGRSSAEYRNETQPEEAAGYSMLVGTAQPEFARWKLDEPAGSTALADSAGNGRTLSVSATGMSKSAVGSGDGGSAFTFDGVNGVAEGAMIFNPAQNVTVGANVRLTAKSADRVVFQQARRQGGFAEFLPYAYFTLFYDSAVDRWCVQTSESASKVVIDQPKTWINKRTVCSIVSPQLSVWTSLYATLDAGTKKLDLYVDGVRVGVDNTAGSAPLPPINSHPLQYTRLGAGGYNVGAFKGEIDEVRLWNRMLHPDEVAAAAVFEAGRWDLDGNGFDTAPTATPRDLENPAVNDEWWQEVGHQDGDAGSLRLAGQRSLSTSGSPIRTDQSFTVSAWVNLSTLEATNKAAVSQDGTYKGAFFLGARQFSTGVRWTFSMMGADATTNDPMIHAEGASPLVEEDTGTWVHLVGVYDAPAQQIRLYLDGQLVKPTARTPRWNAGGALGVGRYRWYSSTLGAYDTDFWTGGIDGVRVYAGTLSPSLVARLHATTDGQL
jgi:hypothetical protein